jgi:hypothetical protein
MSASVAPDDAMGDRSPVPSARKIVRRPQSMIPEKPVPDLIRGGYRFSQKIMLRQWPYEQAIWKLPGQSLNVFVT